MKGAETGYATSSDYYLTLSTVLADSDSHASGEADSYTTDSALNEDHAFVIDGGDILTYSTTNIIKANKGSIAFKWKAPLPYNKYTDDFYLLEVSSGTTTQFFKLWYDASAYNFNFDFYNGSNWTTAHVTGTTQSFAYSQWLKFCVTYDISAATTISAYIDSSTAIGAYGTVWTEQSIPNTMYLGSTSGSTSQSDGTFDELRIYAVALTSAEVETLFNTTWS